MDAKTRLKHLNSYTNAHRDIELTEAAITILEKVNSAQRIVAALIKKQQAHLRRFEEAAEKLEQP